ncbi:hypothetical protein [Azospirillum sp. SYSU D00513]|uniref:hypothetical protein n=1 Tax=Azospirillum sp. SYSU D00513 TaxID=2812561 RepID=UPI001A9692C5|nr:hypothetical protein [Azospirillum sp. SYSU D00513]
MDERNTPDKAEGNDTPAPGPNSGIQVPQNGIEQSLREAAERLKSDESKSGDLPPAH